MLTDEGSDTLGWVMTEHSRCRCQSLYRSATLVPKSKCEDILCKIYVLFSSFFFEGFTWAFVLDFYRQPSHELQRQFHYFLHRRKSQVTFMRVGGGHSYMRETVERQKSGTQKTLNLKPLLHKISKVLGTAYGQNMMVSIKIAFASFDPRVRFCLFQITAPLNTHLIFILFALCVTGNIVYTANQPKHTFPACLYYKGDSGSIVPVITSK